MRDYKAKSCVFSDMITHYCHFDINIIYVVLRARSLFLGGVDEILKERDFGVFCLLSPLSSEYSVS